MGSCGCGEVDYLKVYKINDLFLGISLYKGCRYCGSSLIGITIDILTKEQAEVYHIQIEDAVDCSNIDFGRGLEFGSISIKLFEAEDFADNKEIINHEDLKEIINYFDMKEWMQDYSLDLVQDAIDKKIEVFDNFE